MVMWERDGVMYGGSTGGLKSRLAKHMKVTRGKGGGYKALRMVYAVMPGLGEAKQLEQQLLRRMEEAGLPMLSTYDAKKRSRA
jgi:predicted GIY-YIG superfamily endonuclease